MIRVLIVDDSPTARQSLREILLPTKDVEIVGEAHDGVDALEKTLRLRPDAITMDVQMPRKDGFAAIREIMSQAPTPIVVICAGGDDTNLGIGLKALQLGAVEVLEKPRAGDSKKYLAQCEAIRTAVRAMKGVKVISRMIRSSPMPTVSPQAISCVGIVGSTGAPAVLRRIVEGLPKQFPIPILIVQHIVDTFCAGLAKWLSSYCQLPVDLARDGDALEPGRVFVAPGGRHMMVSMGRVRLDDGPAIRNLKPSGSILLASLAREFGSKAGGFVLTGMGDDGATGLKLIHERGGYTAAQGPLTSVVYGMPKVAFETGAAKAVLEVDELVPALLQLVGMMSLEPGANADNFDPPTPDVPAMAASHQAPSVQTKRRKLLLVDDTETILHLEQGAFKSSYDLVIARNGREALTALERYHPDGVVMDIKMPLMCGDEALREMRDKPRWKDLPVVMVTSETDPELLRFCSERCQAIVRKPFDIEVLKGVVRKFVPTEDGGI